MAVSENEEVTQGEGQNDNENEHPVIDDVINWVQGRRLLRAEEDGQHPLTSSQREGDDKPKQQDNNIQESSTGAFKNNILNGTSSLVNASDVDDTQSAVNDSKATGKLLQRSDQPSQPRDDVDLEKDVMSSTVPESSSATDEDAIDTTPSSPRNLDSSFSSTAANSRPGAHLIAARVRRGVGGAPIDIEDNSPTAEEGGGQPLGLTSAVAVSRDDIVQEVRDQMIAEAITATEAVSIASPSDSFVDRRRKLCVIVVIVIISVTVALAVANNKNKKSPVLLATTASGGTMSPTPGPTTATTQTSTFYPTEVPHDQVYVISMDLVRFCDHDEDLAKKCGGSLASITTQEEKETVDELMKIALHEVESQNLATTSTHNGVWIGGEQAIHSRSDNSSCPEFIDISNRNPACPKKDEVLWYWTDHSSWFDGILTSSSSSATSTASSYWLQGEPNNLIEMDENDGKVIGEHNIFLTAEGYYTDEQGCSDSLSPKAPGIYILPIDYDDNETYPECSLSPLLLEHTRNVPRRPNPDYVYVLSDRFRNPCSGPNYSRSDAS